MFNAAHLKLLGIKSLQSMSLLKASESLLPHLAPTDQLDRGELSVSCQLGATSGIIIHPQQYFTLPNKVGNSI